MAYEAFDAQVIQYGRLPRERQSLRSTRLPAASWLGLVVAVVLIVAAAVTLSLTPNVAQLDAQRVTAQAPADG